MYAHRQYLLAQGMAVARLSGSHGFSRRLVASKRLHAPLAPADRRRSQFELGKPSATWVGAEGAAAGQLYVVGQFSRCAGSGPSRCVGNFCSGCSLEHDASPELVVGGSIFSTSGSSKGLEVRTKLVLRVVPKTIRCLSNRLLRSLLDLGVAHRGSVPHPARPGVFFWLPPAG